ncbi:MAG: DUF4147 domain-containing protein [Patescibacteria group bacterium]
MGKKWIKNFDELATSENRKLALMIAQTGLDAIDTEKVIYDSVQLKNNILSVNNQSFDLSRFKKIKVVGFGKASCSAALALEKILGSKIKQGSVIGLQKTACNYIQTFSGTHPRPSRLNIVAGKKIFEIANQSDENDLIIAIISGGGSALLCYSESECVQGQILYDAFLKCGKTIRQINAVRKHLSVLKGGGLAQIAYPATVISLIFSDVPGDNFQDVASGPTYKDESTVEDARKIILENNLGEFDLIETPKEDKYFEKVYNFILVSNKTAVEAMERKSRELGFATNVVSTELYDQTEVVLKKIFSAKGDNTIVLAAGEPSIEVKNTEGHGGRNFHMGLQAVKEELLDQNSVFLSFASDGLDNNDGAGVIVDQNIFKKIAELGLNVDDYLSRFDSYSFFEKCGSIIITGPTGANVSDLMILLNRK